MNLRKVKRGLDFKAIFGCVSLNLLAAGAVFAATNIVTGSMLRAIFYTFVSWSVTLSISTGYWLWYLFRETKADRKTKHIIAYSLVIMSLTALLLVYWIVTTLKF
jgi:Kef-type K+ transport system membrane component KefB